jgi:hypothetical protein
MTSGDAKSTGVLITEVTNQLRNTLIAKNTDYGDTANSSPLLASTIPPRTAILVRMSDKISRLQNLLKGNPASVAESIDDTMADLAGYAVLYLVQGMKEPTT